MRENWNPKQLIIPLTTILIVFISLFVVDSVRGVYNVKKDTLLSVYVTDLDGRPLKDAVVKVEGNDNKYLTNEKGYTQNIPVKRLNEKTKDFFNVYVTVQLDKYINTVLFGCVIYDNTNRVVQIRLYKDDDSYLPFVAYSEIPPDTYIYTLFDNINNP